MTRISTIALVLAPCVAFPQAAPAPSEFTYTVDKSQRMSPVTGAPYSADEVHEFTLPAADGTPIPQSTTTLHVYRDSQGRTRKDQPVPRTDFTIVEIQDPVARCEYVLDPQRKIAHRLKPPLFEIYDAHKAGRKKETPMAAPAAGVAPIVNVPLGTRTIEGVMAEGTRQTIDLPGSSHRRKRRMAFKATMEIWNSPELEVQVLSINSSDRFGETVTKLIHISRSEPDRALFQVPAGYTVVDESDTYSIVITRP